MQSRAKNGHELKQKLLLLLFENWHTESFINNAHFQWVLDLCWINKMQQLPSHYIAAAIIIVVSVLVCLLVSYTIHMLPQCIQLLRKRHKLECTRVYLVSSSTGLYYFVGQEGDMLVVDGWITVLRVWSRNSLVRVEAGQMASGMRQGQLIFCA